MAAAETVSTWGSGRSELIVTRPASVAKGMAASTFLLNRMRDLLLLDRFLISLAASDIPRHFARYLIVSRLKRHIKTGVMQSPAL
jgi:hypothetical protein